MNNKDFLLIIIIIMIIGFISCEKENTNVKNGNSNDTLFFDNFENIQISKKNWIFKGLAGIIVNDTINNYISVSSFTQRDMGHTGHGDGTVYTSITGLEFDKLIFELSYKAFIGSDDGPTVFKLSQIKKGAVFEIINISENSTDNWKSYQMFDTVFDLRKEDTLRILINNTFGFMVGSHVSKFDNILINKK